MGSPDETIEINILERRLLSGSTSNEYADADDDTVLYSASFEEMEDNYVKYQTAVWILYSLLLILAWGIGVFMLLYLPIRRHILRMDFQSRKLYVTTNAIIYKVKSWNIQCYSLCCNAVWIVICLKTGVTKAYYCCYSFMKICYMT